MSKLLFLAVLAGLVISSVAQSPPPPPTPAKAAKEKQQLSGSKTDSGNPSQQPIIRPGGKDKYTEAQSGKSRDKSSTDWWIVIFTGMLTLVGILQYWAMRQQAGYMRDGLTETRRSVDAARASAGAAMKSVALAEQVTTITQRAVILIESVVAKPQIGGAHPYFSANSVLIFTLKNYGSTVAREVRAKGNIYYPGGVRNFSDKASSTIAPQGSNEWISDPMFFANPQQDRQITIANQGSEGVVRYDIEVTYKDAFEKIHVYKAEWAYIAVLRAFTIMGSASD